MAKHQLNWDVVDPLALALHSLRVNGVFYCQSELSAPWGLAMPATPNCLCFHAITRGTCELVAQGRPVLRLGAGDFVLLTQGEGHRLRTAPGVRTPGVLNLQHETMSDRYAQLRYGGGGQETSLVCGIVRIDHHASRDLIGVLPPVIHLSDAKGADARSMQNALRLMADEVQGIHLGGETITTRLADILVIHTIRAWLNNDSAPSSGWLAAFKDPKVGRALAMIHHEPGNHWTVQALAKQIAMSRAAFAARFSQLVGEAPMLYVTRVRMMQAKDLLSEGGLSVTQVAERLGYDSTAAFSRAFKRFSGTSPSAVPDRRFVRTL